MTKKTLETRKHREPRHDHAMTMILKIQFSPKTTKTLYMNTQKTTIYKIKQNDKIQGNGIH